MLSNNLSVTSATPLQDMISPVTNPVEFEEPRHSTEVRPLYVYHEIDDKFVTQGGHAQVYALQARAKILDDLSFIATKDGIVRLALIRRSKRRRISQLIRSSLSHRCFQIDEVEIHKNPCFHIVEAVREHLLRTRQITTVYEEALPPRINQGGRRIAWVA